MTFWELLSEYGSVGLAAVITALLLFLAIAALARADVKLWGIRLNFDRRQSQSPSRVLLEHDFFLNQAEIEWTGLEFGEMDPRKKAVIEAFYRHICKVARSSMEELVRNIEAKKAQPVDLLDVMSDVVAQYEEDAKTLRIELPSGAILPCVPARLVEVFGRWGEPHVRLIRQKCADVIRSNFHSTERAKTIALLDVMDVCFRIILQDLQGSAQSMNGHLEEDLRAAEEACCG